MICQLLLLTHGVKKLIPERARIKVAVNDANQTVDILARAIEIYV